MTKAEENVMVQLQALFGKVIDEKPAPMVHPMQYVEGHIKERSSFYDVRTGRQVVVERR